MKSPDNQYSAEDERFLHMMDSHHKMGIEMCNDILRNSLNPEVVDLANQVIKSLYFQMQEIQKLMY